MDLQDPLPYIKKMKKLGEEEWKIERFEIYLFLSVYHVDPKLFPSEQDVDYRDYQQVIHTIPLEWIQELGIQEDLMTLLFHLPVCFKTHFLKAWAFFLYGFNDKVSFNIDNVIQLDNLIRTKTEKEKKVAIAPYFPKLLFLRGMIEEQNGDIDKAMSHYILLFECQLDLTHPLCTRGTLEVLYRLLFHIFPRYTPEGPMTSGILPTHHFSQWDVTHLHTVLIHCLKLFEQLDIKSPMCIMVYKQLIQWQIEHAEIFPIHLDLYFAKYFELVSALIPFPLAPTLCQYSSEIYSTQILPNKRIHELVDLYMKRVLSEHCDKQAFVDFLKRCLGITFHSLKILRYLAVTLSSLGEYEDAIRYINVYKQIQPHHTGDPLDDTVQDYVAVLILASRLLLIEMDEQSASIEYAQEAIQLSSNPLLKSRALQLMGIAHMGLADSRHGTYDKAIACLLQATELDARNWMIQYQISLCYFKSFDTDNSLKHAKIAVQLNKFHVPSWHILTLLQNDLEICRLGFNHCVQMHHPRPLDDRHITDFMNVNENVASSEDMDQVAAQLIQLKLTESYLIEVQQGPKEALKICKEVLKYYKLWNEEDQLERSASRSSLQSEGIPKPVFTHISDTDMMKNKKLKYRLESAISRARTVSRRAKNIRKKRKAEDTVSLTKSSHKTQRQQHILIAIWGRIVSLLIASGQIQDARDSVLELQSIDPLNVDVWIGEAKVLMADDKYDEAIRILESITVDNPSLELLMTLAICYYEIQSYNMAENVLDMVNQLYDSQFTREPWWYMGCIAEHRNELETALDMYEKAGRIEEKEPIRLPSILPRWL